MTQKLVLKSRACPIQEGGLKSLHALATPDVAPVSPLSGWLFSGDVLTEDSISPTEGTPQIEWVAPAFRNDCAKAFPER